MSYGLSNIQNFWGITLKGGCSKNRGQLVFGYYFFLKASLDGAMDFIERACILKLLKQSDPGPGTPPLITLDSLLRITEHHRNISRVSGRLPLSGDQISVRKMGVETDTSCIKIKYQILKIVSVTQPMMSIKEDMTGR